LSEPTDKHRTGARTWRSGPTKSVRVPEALAAKVLAYARQLDRDYVPPEPAKLEAVSLGHDGPATLLAAAPAWVKDAVFYQIFPDRFANGDRTTDPVGAVRWGSKPRNFNHFGGDLAGIREKLPYLQDLGITAIYLTPIFKADSNHKYDASDYLKIDPSFGTNAEFETLLAESHRRGIRVILDGVFNHTGSSHSFFRDCVRKGPASRYWNWYRFFGYPVTRSPKPNYEAWWGYAHLPKLRLADNPEVQAYIFSVTEHWTRLGIDGWRLDVPSEVANPSFWLEWRRRVRAINPEAYLVGEIWEDGLEWIDGHPFDAVTNYRFREAALGFFAYRNLTVDGLDERLSTLRAKMGPMARDATFNLLASHDVPRLVTEAAGDLSSVREAVLFQMVMPGAPVIYYGEELGLAGGRDPDNRRCMPWSKVRDNEVLAFYKRLIAIRQAHPALRGGSVRTLLRHNDFRLFAFLREGRGERVLVVLNSGNRSRSLRLPVRDLFSDGARLTDALSGRTFQVAGGSVALDDIPPRGALILVT
jgi:cyclomaltodextrinase